jgi:hypothetical protein
MKEASEMNTGAGQVDCQISTLGGMGQGWADVPPESFIRRIKLIIRRRLNPRVERRLKVASNDLINWVRNTTGRELQPASHTTWASPVSLTVGDWIRVRSHEEISATLNNWRQFKGCTFMPEMEQYCSTTQRVFKPLVRFVDERDLRVKKSSGIVLLEGVICQGTAGFGRCDRSCLLFWREEWLEKINL